MQWIFLNRQVSLFLQHAPSLYCHLTLSWQFILCDYKIRQLLSSSGKTYTKALIKEKYDNLIRISVYLWSWQLWIDNTDTGVDILLCYNKNESHFFICCLVLSSQNSTRFVIHLYVYIYLLNYFSKFKNYFYRFPALTADKPRQCIKKQRHHFANKGLCSPSCGFSSSHVWMWELNHIEGWV